MKRSGMKNLHNQSTTFKKEILHCVQDDKWGTAFKREILHFVQDDKWGTAFKREILHCDQDAIRGSDI
jgi:hypothetical protein